MRGSDIFEKRRRTDRNEIAAKEIIRKKVRNDNGLTTYLQLRSTIYGIVDFLQ
jgi:hypothetical protein